ncbi:hypothetical protein PVK63_14385 [Aliivibrio sp. S2TY2]|uniref:Uncharacterized protein n=1 Tax=Aliivibrio wodanis TaxID=80852 RepID=A0A5Q4ZYP5_9GAMM|nr:MULTISPECIES: hypothetical protein [Aliivibrio]MDD9175952.1 hypothetical protein [Aliivibrio sp. S3TY1]MDD9193133.1 hypothetical protein [Aliivibrio sp. S2TY2]VVV06975.1 hypothetical protein AW0309160_04469 [Aliivibrio wodanis]
MGNGLTLYESRNYILLNGDSHITNRDSIISGKKGFLKNEHRWALVGGKPLSYEEGLHIDDLLNRDEHEYLEVFLEAV